MTKQEAQQKMKWVSENWKVIAAIGTLLFGGSMAGSASGFFGGVSTNQVDTLIHEHIDPMNKRVGKIEENIVRILYLQEQMATPQQRTAADSAFEVAFKRFKIIKEER